MTLSPFRVRRWTSLTPYARVSLRRSPPDCALHIAIGLLCHRHRFCRSSLPLLLPLCPRLVDSHCTRQPVKLSPSRVLRCTSLTLDVSVVLKRSPWLCVLHIGIGFLCHRHRVLCRFAVIPAFQCFPTVDARPSRDPVNVSPSRVLRWTSLTLDASFVLTRRLWRCSLHVGI